MDGQALGSGQALCGYLQLNEVHGLIVCIKKTLARRRRRGTCQFKSERDDRDGKKRQPDFNAPAQVQIFEQRPCITMIRGLWKVENLCWTT